MVDPDFRESGEGGAPPKKGKLTTVIIAAVIAIAMGVGGFFAGKILYSGKQIEITAPTSDAKAGGDITGKYAGEEPEAKEQPGLLALETFTVNLDDPFGKRYAECDLNLVLKDRNLVPGIKENVLVMAKIRHEIFMTISAKSYGDLKSTAGKITLFEEIQMRVNEILKEQLGVEPVVEVLQTRFLMQ
jgi:flagellar basal body-associated protein FliL